MKNAPSLRTRAADAVRIALPHAATSRTLERAGYRVKPCSEVLQAQTCLISLGPGVDVLAVAVALEDFESAAIAQSP